MFEQTWQYFAIAFMCCFPVGIMIYIVVRALRLSKPMYCNEIGLQAETKNGKQPATIIVKSPNQAISRYFGKLLENKLRESAEDIDKETRLL